MTKEYQVELSNAEIYIGATVGVMRNLRARGNGYRDAYGASPRMSWQINIEGALGEMAVAKLLGLYWNRDGRLGGDDVGNLQVRTRSSHAYDLIVHPKDEDEAPFILVTGTGGDYKIRGWIYGKSAKKQKYWKDPAGGRPAYFVPQSDLYSMDSLRVFTQDRREGGESPKSLISDGVPLNATGGAWPGMRMRGGGGG